MHTSHILDRGHFGFTRNGGTADATTLFPDYHSQDRIGVVAPVYEEGLECCGGTVLALTTLFYDAQRASGRNFFTYPQHFCVLAWNAEGVRIRRGHVKATRNTVGQAWCKLDVWPDNRWLAADPTPAAMLKAVFDHQLNRLFWPAGFWPKADAAPALPDFARAILETDLKQVLLYGGDGDISVIASAPAAKLVATAQRHAPVAMTSAPVRERRETFAPMAVSDFIDALTHAFATEG